MKVRKLNNLHPEINHYIIKIKCPRSKIYLWTSNTYFVKLEKKYSRQASSRERQDSKWTSSKFVWWRAKVWRQPAVSHGHPLRLRTLSPWRKLNHIFQVQKVNYNLFNFKVSQFTLQFSISGWRLAGVKCLQHCKCTIFNLGLFKNSAFRTVSSKKPQLSPINVWRLVVWVATT